jgi:hypothetical protein
MVRFSTGEELNKFPKHLKIESNFEIDILLSNLKLLPGRKDVTNTHHQMWEVACKTPSPLQALQ